MSCGLRGSLARLRHRWHHWIGAIVIYTERLPEPDGGVYIVERCVACGEIVHIVARIPAESAHW